MKKVPVILTLFFGALFFGGLDLNLSAAEPIHKSTFSKQKAADKYLVRKAIKQKESADKIAKNLQTPAAESGESKGSKN